MENSYTMGQQYEVDTAIVIYSHLTDRTRFLPNVTQLSSDIYPRVNVFRHWSSELMLYYTKPPPRMFVGRRLEVGFK